MSQRLALPAPRAAAPAAGASGGWRVQKKCEAYFYAGSRRLVAGDRAVAEEYFKKCVDTGQRNYLEYRSAQAELEGLKAGK